MGVIKGDTSSFDCSSHRSQGNAMVKSGQLTWLSDDA